MQAEFGDITRASFPAIADPPARAVFRIDRTSSERFFVLTVLSLFLQIALAVGFSIASMMGLHAFASRIQAQVRERLMTEYDVDIVKEPPPPPKEEVQEEPKPEPAAKPAEVKEKAAPSPAQAGQALTQEQKPDEPVDMTSWSIVTGNGQYVGGTTSSNGTSKTPVSSLNIGNGGARGGTGNAPGPVIDRTRPAGLLRPEWNCPFPAEADSSQVDDALVTLQVAIRADGSADSVTVAQDPGHGFGREAKRCALRERYRPAYDMQGNPVPTKVTIPVRFTR